MLLPAQPEDKIQISSEKDFELIVDHYPDVCANSCINLLSFGGFKDDGDINEFVDHLRTKQSRHRNITADMLITLKEAQKKYIELKGKSFI